MRGRTAQGRAFAGWALAGAGAVISSLSSPRYNIIGATGQRFSLEGSTGQRSKLLGAVGKRFEIEGANR